MADDLHTSNQKIEEPANLSPAINEAILDLKKAFSDQTIDALSWNKHYIAIPLDVAVDLPARGPVGSLDIQKREPIYLLLHRQHYPHKAPSAWSNRKNFPASMLPHLNPTSPGMAANFCLHRGNFDNWFAEHTIVDVVQRIRSWLRDAARDRLIRKEGGFEFTRISDTLGYTIYEPSALTEVVYKTWRQNKGTAGFCFLWYDLLKNPSKDPLIAKDTYAIRLACSLLSEDTAKPREVSLKLNGFHSEDNKLERMLFGVLAWPSKRQVCGRYFTELPDTLRAFVEWGKSFGIPTRTALQTYLSKDLQLLGGVPVTVVIPRPQRVIGSSSRLELLNFTVNAAGDHWPEDGEWNLDAKVTSIGHRVPLTVRRARDISSQPEDVDFGRLLFLGCGAVGSKLALHLAKSGQPNMTLADYDELSPHNLVRHGLLHESTGRNKAEAVKEAIQGIFYADKSVKVDTYKSSALDLFLGQNQSILKAHKWIIDATASSMMLNALSQAKIPDTLACCRCEIADHGQLGFLSVEGANRNPRLDDLQIILFDMALKHPLLSQWLQENKEQREQQIGSALEEINIGISCSSETMRLSDELVSLHAASFATGFRSCAKKGIPNSAGRIQVSEYCEKGQLTSIVQHYDVGAMTVVSARNDPSWQVRLKHGLVAKMQILLRHAKPNETGGLLIGMVHFKRKTVYITRVLPAPADSVSSPYAFVRGIQDLPETVYKIQNLTGGMLGYVGEWHTHPDGGPNLSLTDREAVEKVKSNLDSIPLPTHVMIVTARGIYPHIFTP